MLLQTFKRASHPELFKTITHSDYSNLVTKEFSKYCEDNHIIYNISYRRLMAISLTFPDQETMLMFNLKFK